MFYCLFNSFLNTDLSSVFGNLIHGISTDTSFFSGGKKHYVAAITGGTRENRKGLHHLLHISIRVVRPHSSTVLATGFSRLQVSVIWLQSAQPSTPRIVKDRPGYILQQADAL